MDLVKSSIISCSRRTDIPAFLMDWVVTQIAQKYVETVNPFNHKVSVVSLDPQDVVAWVWWSKNFGPWIEAYRESSSLLRKYPIHIFNFTINSVSELESGLNLPLWKRFEQLDWLISTFGADSIQVRFDPIVFYRKVGHNQLLHNLTDFEYIVSQLSSLGIQNLIFSFVQAYSKVKKRMFHRGKSIIELTEQEKKVKIDELLDICTQHGISLYACCQPSLVGYRNIEQAHCVNGELIQRLSNGKMTLMRDKGQRKDCGCQKSRDIGGYTGMFKCKHNCDYCYANPIRT